MKVMMSARSKKQVWRDHCFVEQFDWKKPFWVTLFIVAMLEIVNLVAPHPLKAVRYKLFPTPVGVSLAQHYGRIWFAAIIAAHILIINGAILLLFKGISGHKVKFAALLRANVHSWGDLAVLVGYSSVGLIFVLCVASSVGLSLPLQPADAVDNLTAGATGLGWWLMIGNIAVLSPLMEELVYRGVCFNMLRASLLSYRTRWVRSSSTDVAAAISAAMFALCHQEAISQYPPVFFKYWGAGLALAWTYQRSGKLSAAVLAHMFANGIASCLHFWFSG